MKKTLLYLASAALILTGCAKDVLTEDGTGGTKSVSVSVQLPSSETKAEADNDGNAAKATRWIMEVRDAQGQLFYRTQKTADAGTLLQTFEVTLIKNQNYDFLFWADSNSSAYDVTDLTNVTLSDPSGYTANDDARDAFSASVPYKSVAAETITAQLKRPFGQVNVITTDLVTLWKQAQTTSAPATTYKKFEPKDFTMKVKVPTSFNVKTQECGEASQELVVMTSASSYKGYKDDKVTPQEKNNYILHKNPATLYMDYVFAPQGQKAVVDMLFYFTSNGEQISYNFATIPVQGNYRTNIKGQFLSNTTTWNVEIVPAFAGEHDVEVKEATVDNIDALNELLNNVAGETQELIATVTKPEDSNDVKVEFPDKTDGKNVVINFSDDLGDAKTINFENLTDAEGPANLTVNAPAGTTLNFNTPMSHVVINGTSYENITGSFSANSLIIPYGVSVKKLEIEEGGLEIHGTLEEVSVTGTEVYVRTSEGLSSTVYEALKDYIAPGFYGQEKDGLWNIVAGNNWTAFAAKEYSKYDASTKTIEIGSAQQFARFANEVNGGNTFKGWTINLINDIDMLYSTDSLEFTPIGNFSDKKDFRGTFDGQNHNIKNIYVYSKDKKGVGVFGKVYTPSVIKNLNVIDATVKAEGDNAYTGGLVGHGYGTIENCTFRGTVYGGNQAAGIAASGGFTIKNCTFDGTLYGKYWALAGIIGHCQGSYPITGNTAKGKIVGECDQEPFVAGGIIGCALKTSYDVKDNYSAMDISYNGAKQTLYPIMGVYNIEAPGTGDKDFQNLLTKVSGNTWDKNIYKEDSYSIDHNTLAPAATDLFLNYGAATTQLILATVKGVGYPSVEAAIAAASAGDVVKVYGTTDFTKADDGFCYTDAANKTGRLVLTSLVNPGSETTSATINVSTATDPMNFQKLFLGSERRLEAAGTYLKNGDVVILPAKTFYVENKSTIYDVYGDITWLGMKDKTVMKVTQAAAGGYRAFRLYNRYESTVKENIIYHYNFKDILFDGNLQKHAAANLFIVTCYNIQINMDGCTVTGFPGSVFSIWANDTYHGYPYQERKNAEAYPKKSDNVGVEVNIKNSVIQANGRLVHYDCSPYNEDVTAGRDYYAFIHVNYDAATVFDNNIDMYSFNANTAKDQGNCLLNGKDVWTSSAE